MHDVAVVGASACGLLASSRLAEKGLDVVLFERAHRFEPAPRTLIVTDRMRSYLHGLGESSVVNEIRRFELFAGDRVATVELGRPDLIIERSALIRELAKEAETAGVSIRLGNRFRELRPAPLGLEMDLEGPERDVHRARARVVIGADGANSRVAAAAGWPRQPTVSLVQAIVRLPADIPPDTSRVWFRPEDTPYFYWLVPESPEVGALGVIGEDPRVIRKRLDALISEKGFEVLEYQGARIPVNQRWTPLDKRIGDGVAYLVGDAAGHVKVSTVGGIVTGFRGVVGVTDQILGRRDYELRRLRRELAVHRLVRRFLHRFDQDDYVRLLDMLDDSTRRPLAELTRDDAPRVVWQVMKSQPRMLPLALRSMLSRSSGGSIAD